MQALVIKSEHPEDIQKIKAYAEQLRAECRIYTEDKMEDWGMQKLMREADRSETAPSEEIMHLLDAE